MWLTVANAPNEFKRRFRAIRGDGLLHGKQLVVDTVFPVNRFVGKMADRASDV
jgi:hypothetical protein